MRIRDLLRRRSQRSQPIPVQIGDGHQDGAAHQSVADLFDDLVTRAVASGAEKARSQPRSAPPPVPPLRRWPTNSALTQRPCWKITPESGKVSSTTWRDPDKERAIPAGRAHGGDAFTASGAAKPEPQKAPERRRFLRTATRSASGQPRRYHQSRRLAPLTGYGSTRSFRQRFECNTLGPAPDYDYD